MIELPMLKLFYQEDYTIKEVDLVSGIGGAVGLYLGWSVMTFGNSLVDACYENFKKLLQIKIF